MTAPQCQPHRLLVCTPPGQPNSPHLRPQLARSHLRSQVACLQQFPRCRVRCHWNSISNIDMSNILTHVLCLSSLFNLAQPSSIPSNSPSLSAAPSKSSSPTLTTAYPSVSPSISAEPTPSPSSAPSISKQPSFAPTAMPSSSPSESPTVSTMLEYYLCTCVS